MRQIETSAKKIEQAVEEGIRILGVSEDEVKVEILSTGGLFRKAKVRLTVVDEFGNPVPDRTDLSSVSDEELVRAFGVSEKPNFEPAKKEKPKFERKEKFERKDENKGRIEKKGNIAKTDKACQEGKADKSKQKCEVKQETKEKFERKFERKEETKVRTEKKLMEKKAPESARPVPIDTEKILQADDAVAKRAKEYLSKLLEKMSVTAMVDLSTANGVISLDIVTDDSTVIGHHGEVLDALQTLTKRAVEESDDKYVNLVVDSKNYRSKRESSLVALAEKMANKCVRTGRKIVLEPMSNSHRKIIHSTLTANDKVITRSEGREPNRRVVILPKRTD